MAHKDSRECYDGTKKHEKVPRDYFGPKELVKSEPEYHKYAVNSSIFLKIQRHFWSILSHSTGYQTSF